MVPLYIAMHSASWMLYDLSGHARSEVDVEEEVRYLQSEGYQDHALDLFISADNTPVNPGVKDS